VICGPPPDERSQLLVGQPLERRTTSTQPPASVGGWSGTRMVQQASGVFR
jgi:hypothetical protein